MFKNSENNFCYFNTKSDNPSTFINGKMKHNRFVPLMRYFTNKVVWKLSLDEEPHTGLFMADDPESAH